MPPNNDEAAVARLLTLPPEVRSIIYAHLFTDLTVHVHIGDQLDLQGYPYQISGTNSLLRRETLPLLRKIPSSASKAPRLTLSLDHGYFPTSIRRRLPQYIYNTITHITLLTSILYDHVQPNLRTFPSLHTLTFALSFTPDYTFEDRLCDGSRAQLSHQGLRENLTALARQEIKCLHEEACAPREGLERDYLPEGTLWEVLGMDRARRGFDVEGRMEYFEYGGRSLKRRVVELDLESRKVREKT